MNLHHKAYLYDKVIQILNDRISLEKHKYPLAIPGDDSVVHLRAEAYGAIVNILLGHRVLPGLPISEARSDDFFFSEPFSSDR